MDDQGDPMEPCEVLASSDRALEKPKRTPPSRKGIPPTNAWPKGTSGNPAGRPRAGLALAERIRERIDPDVVVDLVKEIVDDENIPAERRLAAVLSVTDRGFVKPPVGVAVSGGTPTTNYPHLAGMTAEQLRVRLAWLKGEVLELGTGADMTPEHVDEPQPNEPIAMDTEG